VRQAPGFLRPRHPRPTSSPVWVATVLPAPDGQGPLPAAPHCPTSPSRHGFKKATGAILTLLSLMEPTSSKASPPSSYANWLPPTTFFLSGEHCCSRPTSPFPLIVRRLMFTAIPRSCRVAVKLSATMRCASPPTNATGLPSFPPP
jgi:hypothetical protein